MRILLVNFEFPPLGGGAANATLFLGKALASLGHHPVVLTCALRGQPPVADEGAIRVHRLASLRRAPDRTNIVEMAAFMLVSLASATRIAREERIDGAVTFFTIPCGPTGWWLDRRMDIPYVVSLRGGDVPEHVPELRLFHRVVAPVRRAALRRARAVVANSPGLARLSERIDHVPVRVIPNGVDTEVFRSVGMPVESGPEFRILFVGRLHELKNIDLLLRAASELVPGDRPFHLDIVGDGPERPALEALAARLDIADRVTWHGWRSKEEVAALYRSASCFANPSRYEGLPNTVLEAMASSLPVLASDVGGNNDLVSHGSNGLLFDLSRPGDLATHLGSLAADPARAREMGARGRDLVARKYSWLGVARQYIDLFDARAAS